VSAAAYEISVPLPLQDGRVEVVGDSFGPAGLSLLDVDGNVWAVDHADPTQLAVLDTDPDTASGNAMLLAAFGAVAADSAPQGDRPVDATGERSTVHPGGPAAAAAGRLVLLAEMADDSTAHPLVRVAAAVDLGRPSAELAGELRQLVVIDRLRAANALAAQVIETWRFVDAEDVALRLADQCEHTATVLGAFGTELRRLAARLRQATQARGPGEPLALPSASDSLYSTPSFTPWTSERPDTPQPEDFLELKMLAAHRVHITVSRAREGGWVEVRRRGRTDSLLALVPLVQSGLLKTADALVPPGLSVDDFDIEILTVDELPTPPDGPLALTRQAVRAGRSAARADRLGDAEASRLRWTACAELWAAAGDPVRSAAALKRASGDPVRSGEERWTVDEVAELFGV
jgi:hypothetical protein